MQNQLSTAPKTDSKYDILKLVLSIFVLAIHSILFPNYLYPWLRIAVPLFFVMTSYFLYIKLQSAAPENHKAILKAFVLRNIKLYAFWFVICLPVTLIVRRNLYFSNGLLLGFLQFIRGLLFGSTFMASWFITASVTGTLIVYFLSKKLKPFVVFFVCLLAFVLATIDSSYLSVFSPDSILPRAMNVFNKYVNPLHTSFPVSLIWIFLGKCFAENKIRFHSLWAAITLLVISCIGLYIEWRLVIPIEGSCDNDSYFLLLPVVICLFSCLKMIKPVHFRYALDFRRFSTVTYALHGSIVAVLDNTLEDYLSFDVSVIVFFSTLICCIAVYLAITAIIKKYPHTKLSKLLKNAY